MAKWQSMSYDLLSSARVSKLGFEIAAQHSQDWSALVAHIGPEGSTFPTTPTLGHATWRSPDRPVVFLESQKLYDKGEDFEPRRRARELLRDRRRAGDPPRGHRITIAANGATVAERSRPRTSLAEKYGLSAEVIDRPAQQLRQESSCIREEDQLPSSSPRTPSRARLPSLNGCRQRADPGLRRARHRRSLASYQLTPGPEIGRTSSAQVSDPRRGHERILPLPGRVPPRSTRPARSRLNRAASEALGAGCSPLPARRPCRTP